MSNPERGRRSRLPIRNCDICNDIGQQRPGCWLCAGTGLVPLWVYNAFRAGRINRGSWASEYSSSFESKRGSLDWISVKFQGGTLGGAEMLWPRDKPPRVGERRSIPRPEDLKKTAARGQRALFKDEADTYEFQRRGGRLIAVFIPNTAG